MLLMMIADFLASSFVEPDILGLRDLVVLEILAFRSQVRVAKSELHNLGLKKHIYSSLLRGVARNSGPPCEKVRGPNFIHCF